MADEIAKAEFIERFIAHMVKMRGPEFDDGSSIAEYARETAPLYWAEEYQREWGPEECAEADMDCWEYGDG